MAHNTFHVALSVKDLPTAIEHYKKILGIEPGRSDPTTRSLRLSIPPLSFRSTRVVSPGRLCIWAFVTLTPARWLPS